MRSDVKNRSGREAELYDKQRLRRDRFESALTYLNDGVGRLRRNEAIRAAMGEAAGSRVLEIGSQSWEWCLARYGYRPAQLTCINISQTELEIGRAQAEKLGVSCDFRKMDAHDLEFADGSLDMVFGVAILHHLEFGCALREIHRVLRDGGRIVFIEPLRHNPLARLVRWFTPHARTPDELPLGRPELRLIGQNFEVDNYYSELFTVIGAIVARPIFKNPINPLTRFCNFADDRLARMVPAAGGYYRSVVIRGAKEAGSLAVLKPFTAIPSVLGPIGMSFPGATLPRFRPWRHRYWRPPRSPTKCGGTLIRPRDSGTHCRSGRGQSASGVTRSRRDIAARPARILNGVGCAPNSLMRRSSLCHQANGGSLEVFLGKP